MEEEEAVVASTTAVAAAKEVKKKSTRVVSLEAIKACMLQPACFPHPAKKKTKSKGKGKGKVKWRPKGRKVGSDAPAETEAETETEAVDENDPLRIETFRWEGHERVIFLVYPNRVALRQSLTRLSVFLEDPKHSGEVIGADFRLGQYVASAYTGHNFRPSDLASFVEAVESRGGKLEPAEGKLVALLSSEIPDFPPKPRSDSAAGSESAELSSGCESDWGCIATAKGLNGNEVASTLLHESMHGLFYAYKGLRLATEKFWNTEVEEAERELWKQFLGGLGYDVTNEFLVVNELLAYCSTESRGRLFNFDRQLLHLQELFIKFMNESKCVPSPKPKLPGQYCAFK